MKLKTPALLLACIAVSLATQPGAAPALPAPLRDLQFGDINFLHTTDTHGWHAGHLLEPSFSADWGDYVSFSEHLREKLEAEGKDLLVIDTGDRIEGNGLYDASNPRGEYTFGIFTQQHIDLLCSGNHELYKNSSAEDDYEKLVPAYKDNYIATNLQIFDTGKAQFTNLAPPYREFTTKNGVRIMAFGFIFDFTRNDKNTIVKPVELVVREDWFQTAVKLAKVDLFVVIGHVALRQTEFEAIYDAIRAFRPDVPIQFFGGHFHIRDYRVFDKKAHALASGRFMETIGFQSISNIKSDNITFFRRYIDNNLYSLHYHSNTTAATFSTSAGSYTSLKIARARSKLNLDETFGCAPQPYWMSRAPYPANDSIYSLLTDQIFPDTVNPNRANKTRLMLTNTGAIRFDIFEGPFTRDSTYIVSPFTSNLSFIPDVPYRLAKQLLPILNGEDRQTVRTLSQMTLNQKWKFQLADLAPPEQQARNHARTQSSDGIDDELIDYSYEWLRKQHRSVRQREIAGNPGAGHQDQPQSPSSDLPSNIQPGAAQQPLHEQSSQSQSQRPATFSGLPKTPGYTTVDDLGTDGDDTIHTPIAFYDVPNCIQAIIPSPSSLIPFNHTAHLEITSVTRSCERSVAPASHPADDEPVDLIFNEFLTPYILNILNLLQHHGCPASLDPSAGSRLPTDESYERYKEYMLMSERDKERRRSCMILGLCEDEVLPRDVKGVLDSVPVEMEEGKKEKWDLKVEEAKSRIRKYTDDDVSNYMAGETFTSLLAKWVSDNWKENCEEEVREEL